MEMNIRLCSFEDVQTLADLATAQPFQVRIHQGHRKRFRMDKPP